MGNNGMDHPRDNGRVDDIRAEVSALSQGTANDGGRGGAEDKLREDIAVVGGSVQKELSHPHEWIGGPDRCLPMRQSVPYCGCGLLVPWLFLLPLFFSSFEFSSSSRSPGKGWEDLPMKK